MTLQMLLLKKKNDYRTHFWGIAKTEPVSRMKDTELSGKTRRLWLSKEEVFIVVITHKMQQTMNAYTKCSEENRKETKKDLSSTMKKIRLQKWIEINAKDYLRKKPKKRLWKKSVLEYVWGQIKLHKYGKEYRKCKYQSISEKERQKIKELMKKHLMECRKKTLIQQYVKKNKRKQRVEKVGRGYDNQGHQRWCRTFL